MDFFAAIEVLYRLNTGVIGTGACRHERPHKPVMLLAVQRVCPEFCVRGIACAAPGEQ